jgi:hypothetical protein
MKIGWLALRYWSSKSTMRDAWYNKSGICRMRASGGMTEVAF